MLNIGNSCGYYVLTEDNYLTSADTVFFLIPISKPLKLEMTQINIANLCLLADMISFY